jgi:hypothetical protein
MGVDAGFHLVIPGSGGGDIKHIPTILMGKRLGIGTLAAARPT